MSAGLHCGPSCVPVLACMKKSLRCCLSWLSACSPAKVFFPFISFFYIVSLKGQIPQHHQRDKKDDNKTKSQTQAHRTRQAINDLFLFKLSRNSMVACVGCNKVGHIKRNWVLPIRLVLHQYSGEHRPFGEGRLCRMTLQEGYSSGLTCWYQTSRSPVLWTCRLLRLVCLKREQLVNIFFFIHLYTVQLVGRCWPFIRPGRLAVLAVGEEGGKFSPSQDGNPRQRRTNNRHWKKLQGEAMGKERQGSILGSWCLLLPCLGVHPQKWVLYERNTTRPECWCPKLGWLNLLMALRYAWEDSCSLSRATPWASVSVWSPLKSSSMRVFWALPIFSPVHYLSLVNNNIVSWVDAAANEKVFGAVAVVLCMNRTCLNLPMFLIILMGEEGVRYVKR